MSEGIESVPGGMFVEVGYHGVKIPAKLYFVHIRYLAGLGPSSDPKVVLRIQRICAIFS